MTENYPSKPLRIWSWQSCDRNYDFRHRYFSFISAYFSLKFGIQYRNYPNFIPSKYCLGSTLLNFSDRTRTGVFSLIWPLALGRSKIRLCLWSWQSFDRNYDFRHRYFSFISVFCCLKFGIQYRNCPNFISSKYWLGSTLLNFSDRTRTGVFSLIWPLHSTRKEQIRYWDKEGPEVVLHKKYLHRRQFRLDNSWKIKVSKLVEHCKFDKFLRHNATFYTFSWFYLLFCPKWHLSGLTWVFSTINHLCYFLSTRELKTMYIFQIFLDILVGGSWYALYGS